MSPETVIPGLAGTFRDVLRDRAGRVVWDSGPRSNAITDGFRRLLAAAMRGAPSLATSIQGLAVGAGAAAWDAPPGPPPATAAQTALVDPAPHLVPRAALTFDFLVPGGDAVSPVPTNRLQIFAALGPGIPPWPDGSHASATLREFGLVGAIDGSPVLLNYVIHPAIAKDPASTLERTLWLVF